MTEKIVKTMLNNPEVTISKDKFISIASQAACKELAKVYKKPNKKFEKAMGLWSFILAKIVFEIFDKPYFEKLVAKKAETPAEDSGETQETPAEQATQDEPTKEKRYFKVLISHFSDVKVGDIGELVGINRNGQYGLANEKWNGHSCGSFPEIGLVEEKYHNHCWFFSTEHIEEVK